MRSIELVWYTLEASLAKSLPMGGLRNLSVSAAFIGVAVTILVIAAEVPYSPGTLHALISVVPVGKGIDECYRAGSACLSEMTIYVNLSNTMSSPVYVTMVYVNGFRST